MNDVSTNNCPKCHQPGMVIGATQAFCMNDKDCDVLTFNPSLPDGGMSNAQYVYLHPPGPNGSTD